jgi:hypothetical protein
MAARTAALAYVYGIGEPTSARRIASKLGITAQHFSLYCRAASREFGGQRAPHFHGHDWRRRF